MAVNVLDYVGIGIDPKTGKKHAINYLPKVADWEDAIYQYELKDKLIGGVDGLDNVQAQMLANRTEYLKKAMEEKGGAGIEVCTISIPKTGWTKGTGIYEYTIDIPSESITENLIPMLTILPTSVGEAASCGLCPACETISGALRLYAKNEPQTAMEGSLTLIFPKGGGGNVDLPIATKFSIPETGWTKGTGIYEYTIDIPSESITENLIPMLTILPTSVGEAASCGLCPACETISGALRLYAKNEPQTAMEGSLTLIFPKGGGGNVDLPIATESALGAVKIGNGLTVQSDGTLSVNKDTVMTNEDLVDEEEAKADLAEILRNRSGE